MSSPDAAGQPVSDLLSRERRRDKGKEGLRDPSKKAKAVAETTEKQASVQKLGGFTNKEKRSRVSKLSNCTHMSMKKIH